MILSEPSFPVTIPGGTTIGENEVIIKGTDGNPTGLITSTVSLSAADTNYYSDSGIGIRHGTLVQIGSSNTWMIAPRGGFAPPNRIECNFDDAYLDTIHDRDLRDWEDAWQRDFAHTQAFPDIFKILTNIPNIGRLEEVASRDEYLAIRARNSLALQGNEVTGADVYGY